jgi:glycosyltransferase involved in cell wall biosynthesis
MPEKTAVVCLSPYLGGMEMDALRLYQLLHTSTEVRFVCRRDSRIHALAKDKIPTTDIYAVRFGRSFSLPLVQAFRRFVQKESIGNIVFFGASELKSLHFAVHGLDINFCVRHGTTKRRHKKDPLHRFVYADINWHIAVSDHILDNVREIIPYGPQTKDIRIYNSRYLQPMEEQRDLGGLRLVHIGRIARGKGQLDALQAFHHLIDNGIEARLDFLGGDEDDDYRKELEAYCQRAKLKDSVHFHGHVDNVREYLLPAHILLFPSYGEGMPNALTEAMAMQMIPVVYENTVFPEIANLGAYLIMVKNGDVESMGKKLVFIAENLPQQMVLAQVNLQVYNAFFTPRSELRSYLDILR